MRPPPPALSALMVMRVQGQASDALLLARIKIDAVSLEPVDNRLAHVSGCSSRTLAGRSLHRRQQCPGTSKENCFAQLRTEVRLLKTCMVVATFHSRLAIDETVYAIHCSP